MDGVLLEVCNQKEGCYAWILDAATSHIQTWRLLIFLRHNRCNHYLVHPMFRLHNIALPMCNQHRPGMISLWSPSWYILGILRGIPPLFHHIMDTDTDPHVPFAFSCLIVCMSFLTMHWSLSLLWSFHNIKRHHPSTLEIEHMNHVYFRDPSIERIS
jgi:hypothetical protein